MGAGGIVPATSLAAAGGVIPVSLLAGAGGTVQASSSAGVLVPSSNPSLARSIKSPPMLLPSLSFLLCGGVGGGSILLLSGDGGGMGMTWLEGGVPWLSGGTDGEMIWS